MKSLLFRMATSPRRLAGVLALSALFIVPAAGQAQQEEANAVRAAVQTFFTAMLQRDTAGLRASMMPGAVVFNPIRRAQGLTQRVLTIEALNDAVIKTPEPYDERMASSEVRIDGDLAHVWGRYTFRVGARVTNCGRNSVQLVRTDSGWKITHFASTIETAGCDGMPAK